MSTGLPSDEVADDYKNSLEDLVTNDRYQIGNLTVIAKENIEHAEAIARVLENHIQRAPPARKLPALYVLDSIVKNVGTPYTVYFGRNLYNTFMNAYTLVDGNVRKKLDETLKTWREPVPGSLSTTPVFRLDVTQRIVDALSKARQAAQQARTQQPPLAGQRMGTGSANLFRNTPTPPQGVPNYGRSNYNAHQQPPNQTAFVSSHNQPGLPVNQQPAPQVHSQPPQFSGQKYNGPQSDPIDIGSLHHDIDDLIVDAKIDCASHPMNQAARTKLSSLQSLKDIVETGKLSERDLWDVRRSVSEQLAQRVAPSRPTPPISTPLTSTPVPQAMTQQINPPPSVTPSFLNSTNLAELIRATSNRNQPTPPLTVPNLTSVTARITDTPSTPPVTENPLIAQLRASGLLPPTRTPPLNVNVQASPITLAATTASTQHVRTESSLTPYLEVQFTSASMRIPRPHLISTLFSTRPNACSTCGRRFTSDEKGKEQKAQHLDWHFKTKARMAEAEKKGQSRSWYVDEREWISTKEFEDDELEESYRNNRNGPALSSISKGKTQDFVRVPNDSVLKSLPCPIDQEPFVQFWSDELQEFIWKDAIQVGNRIYHASCYRQAIDDRAKAATPVGAGKSARVSTPDSILGKRKAEELANGIATRVKIEGYP